MTSRAAAATVHAPPRRRSGTRPAPTPRRSGAAPRARSQAGSRGHALPRVEFVPLLDRLLRGPLYIAVIGVLLAGIVFFNVDLLKMNHGIARIDVRAAQLKRENAVLTLELAKLGSSERIQRVALERGLVLPQPGDVRYLRSHREDAGRALRTMTDPAPSDAAPAPPVTQTSAPQTSAPPTSSQVAAGGPQTATPVPAANPAPSSQLPAPTAATP